MEELGGARTHNTKSGDAHYLGADEDDAIDYVKALLSYLPQQQPRRAAGRTTRRPTSSVTDDDRALDTLIPDSPNQPYDMHTVIEHVVDDGEFLEVQPLFAPNISSASAGSRAARSASSPTSRCSSPAPSTSTPREKAARFVRTCDAFNIPVLTFVDVPGFLPGTDQEWNGIIRRGAKLIYAYAEATVPLVTVITRKAYGGAYDVMGSKHLGADINLAWPTAQIAVMGAAGRGQHPLPQGAQADAGDDAEADARRADRSEYEDTLANPYIAAERGYVDAVIAPVTRPASRSSGRCGCCAPSARPAAEEAREHPAVTRDRRTHRGHEPSRLAAPRRRGASPTRATELGRRGDRRRSPR